MNDFPIDSRTEDASPALARVGWNPLAFVVLDAHEVSFGGAVNTDFEDPDS